MLMEILGYFANLFGQQIILLQKPVSNKLVKKRFNVDVGLKSNEQTNHIPQVLLCTYCVLSHLVSNLRERLGVPGTPEIKIRLV